MSKLTRTEREVLDLLLIGKGTPEMEVIFGRSKSTVDTHAKRILKKLGYRSRLEMVATILNDRIRELETELETPANGQVVRGVIVAQHDLPSCSSDPA